MDSARAIRHLDTSARPAGSSRWVYGAILFLGAVTLAVWATMAKRFRDGEGFFETSFCLPIGLAASIALIGAGAISRQGRFAAAAFWFSVAMAGQAVALQLIHAGTNVTYQHYPSVRELVTGAYRWHVAFVVGQTVLVLWASRRWMPGAVRWIASHFHWWQLILIGLFVLGSAATKINVTVPMFAEEVAWATFIQLLGLATVAIGCASIPMTAAADLKERFDRLLTRADDADAFAPRVDLFAIGCGLWVVVVATLLGVYIYERHPHVPDEVVYLQHARYFAEGQLTMKPPPVPEAFDMDLMESEPDRWYSPVPIGWPLFLTVGAYLGSPWMVNPILGGLIVIGGYWVLTDLYGRRFARIATLLMCVSPWLLFMSMNVMTHNATLVSAIAATACVIAARRTDRAIWAWLGGGALGMVALIRPVEGLCIAILLGLWSIGIGGRRIKTGAIAGLVLGSMIVASITLPYNKYLTGSAAKFPIMAYVDKHYGPGKNSLGFGPEKGLGWKGVDPFPGHGPLDAVINNNLNAFSVNVELNGWICGSVLFLALAVFGGRMVRSDRLMLAVIALIVGVHVFYWYSGGPDFGARYWYLIFVPCIALVVAAGRTIAVKLAESSVADGGVRVVAGFAAMMIAALFVYIPWRGVDRYHHFRNMRPDVRDLAAENHFGRSLVLIRGSSRSDDYAAAFCYNPIDYESDATIYAWDRADRPDVRKAVVKHYADRPVWIIEGNSLTGGSFRVAAGPLTAEQVLSESWDDSVQ